MAPPIRDLSGQKFSKLMVIAPDGKDSRGVILWKCRCDCGGYVRTPGSRLTSGSRTNCGCSTTDRPQNKAKDITGQRFGRLVVQSRAGTNNDRKAIWNTKCDCGNSYVASGKDLRSGHTKSCGCLPFDTKVSMTHGMSYSREYRIWAGMIQRCTNPNQNSYPNYGGRGITVCKRWMKFSNFLADMGNCPPKFTIERKNNDRGYAPSNCVWADVRTQAANRRSRGSGMCLSDQIRLFRDEVKKRRAK